MVSLKIAANLHIFFYIEVFFVRKSFDFILFFVSLASPNLLRLDKKKNKFLCFVLDFS